MEEEIPFNDFVKKFSVYKNVPFEHRALLICKTLHPCDFFKKNNDIQQIMPFFKPLYELN